MSEIHVSTLQPTRFIDADEPSVKAFAAAHAGEGDPRERAIRLYHAVRDAIRYDTFAFGLDPQRFVASQCLSAPAAFCVPKAIALAAVARASGIPARLGFADVRNHLAPPKVIEMMDDDVFHWHAYTSLFLEGKWVKATPAFDIGLCARHKVKPLDFDGRNDSIFHAFDEIGRKHMEYIRFNGEFDDFPYDAFAEAARTHHGRMLEVLDRERAARNEPRASP
jgi:transglutaminase-like putative cysteine protease